MNETTRVSVASNGTQGNNFSYEPSMSADGRYVAFRSSANNLVPGDTNDRDDIFVHDRTTGTTRRVSVASDGTQGDYGSGEPSVSADGRYVAFVSDAKNLVPGDTNDRDDIFVHDRTTGTTRRVSVASNGSQGKGWSYEPSVSADGRYVAFASDAKNLVAGDTNNLQDIFVHDLSTGTTRRVSVASDGIQGNGWSGEPSVSADGRYVAFSSYADNLVPGDTNENSDIFVHDLSTGTTRRVSVASNGSQGYSWSGEPSVSADGRYVAFASANNLVPGDTNNLQDIFVHDLSTGTTRRVSVASNGTQGNDWSYNPSVSADGRYVAFASDANNLVPGNTNDSKDIFVHDLSTGTTRRVSVASDGTRGNDWSYEPAVSADGRYVAFSSYANNLVPRDTNDSLDIFVHDLAPAVSSVSIDNVSVIEGFETQANFTVSLSSPAADTIKVNYETENGTALADSDYRAKSGVLTFRPGETTKTFSIKLINDNLSEPEESFQVNLTNSTANATILQGQGLGKISDTFFTASTTTLPNKVENLTLTGSNPVDGTGNQQDNILTGNNSSNLLGGEKGNDTILAHRGNDTLRGGQGNDLLTGGNGRDYFAYTSGRAYNSQDFGTDTLTDFGSQDKIFLSKNTFRALGSAVGNGLSVASDLAVVGSDTQVANSAAFLVFSSETNTLFYNANGAADGLGRGSDFAVLNGVTSLNPNQFVVGS